MNQEYRESLDVTTERVDINEGSRVHNGQYIFTHRRVRYSCDANELFDHFSSYFSGLASEDPKFNVIYSVAELTLLKETNFNSKLYKTFKALAVDTGLEKKMQNICGDVSAILRCMVQDNSGIKPNYVGDIRSRVVDLLRYANKPVKSRGKGGEEIEG